MMKWFASKASISLLVSLILTECPIIMARCQTKLSLINANTHMFKAPHEGVIVYKQDKQTIVSEIDSHRVLITSDLVKK